MAKLSRSIDAYSLPYAIAQCALQRALRPALKQDVRFVACLYVENAEQLFTYEAAAEKLLLQREMGGIRLSDDSSSVAAFLDDVAMLPRIKGDIQSYRRVTFLFASKDLIPEPYRSSAEFVCELGPPDTRLVRGAVYHFCGERISDDDAQLIADANWSDLLAVFRKGRSVKQAIRRLRLAGEKSAKSPAETLSRPLLPDNEILATLRGYGAATGWAKRLVTNLALAREGLVAWSRVERNILLFGPPGTGKSDFGRIVAAACGVPLIVGSYPDWQSAGHQGEMLKAMKATFDEAKKKAPCVLLLEEIDCFDSRDKVSDHADYMRAPVSGMLLGLDDLFRHMGVIVIATTNYIEQIDKAILRPGRIDCHVEIGFPDAKERCGILAQHLQWQLPVDFEREVGMATFGLPGAGLKKLAEQIHLRCLTESLSMGMEVIRSCLPKVSPIPIDRARVSALHECGHALVGLRAGRSLSKLELSEYYVEDQPEYELGHTRFEHLPFHRRTPDFLVAEIGIALGGIASEIELFGAHRDGAGGSDGTDLVVATHLATKYEAIYGMGETLVSEVYRNRDQLAWLRQQNPTIWHRVDSLLRQQLAETRRLISENREAIVALADELVRVKSMSGAEVAQFLKPFGVFEAATSLPQTQH
jgi:hypothetical protein